MATDRKNLSCIEGWGILIVVPALIVLAYIYPLIPHSSDVPLCGVKYFLGFDCPGCGLTRSFVALVHGRARLSVDHHPLGIVIMLWLLYMFGRAAVSLIAGRRLPDLLTQKQRDVVMYAFLAALLASWIAKCVILI